MSSANSTTMGLIDAKQTTRQNTTVKNLHFHLLIKIHLVFENNVICDAVNFWNLNLETYCKKLTLFIYFFELLSSSNSS